METLLDVEDVKRNVSGLGEMEPDDRIKCCKGPPRSGRVGSALALTGPIGAADPVLIS